MTITVKALSNRVENAFSFLATAGFQLKNCEYLFSESFKGGFVLTYADPKRQVVVRYLDMEFEVTQQNQEVFGSANHPEFSGNMFSREHLAEHIDQIGRVVERALSSTYRFSSSPRGVPV